MKKQELIYHKNDRNPLPSPVSLYYRCCKVRRFFSYLKILLMIMVLMDGSDNSSNDSIGNMSGSGDNCRGNNNRKGKSKEDTYTSITTLSYLGLYVLGDTYCFIRSHTNGTTTRTYEPLLSSLTYAHLLSMYFVG